MKTLIAAACFVLTLAGTAAAADANGSYKAIGAGASTCAQYVAAPAQVGTIVAVWVQGYATALNQVVPGSMDVTAGKGDTQMAQEITRVCNKNPNMLVSDAAREMVMKLGGLPRKTAKKGAKAEAPAAGAEAVPELRR